MTRVDDANDDDELVYESTYFDIALPHGWTRVAHNSGLFCFLHEPSGVVAWSQPYVVQVIDRNGRTTLDDMVQAHRPPIEIFAAGCGMRQPDLNRPVKLAQAESILRRLNHAAQAPTTHQQDQRPAAVPDARTHNEPSRPPQSADAPASRKRRLPDDDDDVTSSDIAPPPPAANYERVVVGDVTMDNPAGKTAMVFLTEYLAAAGRAGPQFVQSASTGALVDAFHAVLTLMRLDPTLPFRCAVVLDGAEYSHGVAVTKALARQVASENALEALLPGYWAGLKKEGAVRDVVSNVPQPPATDWAKPISTATTMDDFETMSIDDPGVLQGCMELSFKTPAQLLMEFQTKHKGIAVNYTTVPVPGGSGGDRNKFRVTASAGPSAAEGVASNKKLAKQFAAQALLAQLNPRVATYIELIRVHENSVKSHADGAHRAKMQKFSGKYGAKHATTPATTSGSAAPSILPTPPSSILPTPPSTTPAGGPLLERSSARTSHGQGYSRGPSNPSGYNSASTTSNDVADAAKEVKKKVEATLAERSEQAASKDEADGDDENSTDQLAATSSASASVAASILAFGSRLESVGATLLHRYAADHMSYLRLIPSPTWKRNLPQDDDMQLLQSEVLVHYPVVQDKLEALVPGTVDADTFWSHYLYKASLLAAQEERRALLLEKGSTVSSYNQVHFDVYEIAVGGNDDDDEEIAWDVDSPTHEGSAAAAGPMADEEEKEETEAAMDDTRDRDEEAAAVEVGTAQDVPQDLSTRHPAPPSPEDGWVDVPDKDETAVEAPSEAAAVAADDDMGVDWGDDDDDESALPHTAAAGAPDEWGQWE
ncbi:hypothetical protein DYB25_002914 [Aphanomyces astaci]|uniref:BSD domain-containing protein n=2 Tax=Aphanomyces astaci TaxID=112090 RepID=A0A397BNE1_APHAT|nr:hypothetical protein DYB25_002914 [Aphanomyces astaci]RHY57662.1 hypothetical protein DYB38_007214 [Aphanomyces astaci]RHY66595.1 hypothetical protein DYB34_002099 [Aphanomyces astaci]RHZ10096.1 hypothetical protein DYB31_003784 [Aphanomyces astaci]